MADSINNVTSAEWGPSLAEFGKILEAEDAINQRIGLLIGTEKGSRPFIPSFGCDLHNLVGRPITEAGPQMVVEVINSIAEFMPEIEVSGINYEATETDQIRLRVAWILQQNRQRGLAEILIGQAGEVQLAPPPPPSLAPVLAPFSLDGEINYTDKLVALNWEFPESTDDYGFQIFRSKNGGPFERIQTVFNVVNWDDQTVNYGNEYSYKVRAVLGGRLSEFSNEVSFSLENAVTFQTTWDVATDGAFTTEAAVSVGSDTRAIFGQDILGPTAAFNPLTYSGSYLDGSLRTVVLTGNNAQSGTAGTGRPELQLGNLKLSGVVDFGEITLFGPLNLGTFSTEKTNENLVDYTPRGLAGHVLGGVSIPNTGLSVWDSSQATHVLGSITAFNCPNLEAVVMGEGTMSSFSLVGNRTPNLPKLEVVDFSRLSGPATGAGAPMLFGTTSSPMNSLKTLLLKTDAPAGRIRTLVFGGLPNLENGLDFRQYEVFSEVRFSDFGGPFLKFSTVEYDSGGSLFLVQNVAAKANKIDIDLGNANLASYANTRLWLGLTTTAEMQELVDQIVAIVPPFVSGTDPNRTLRIDGHAGAPQPITQDQKDALDLLFFNVISDTPIP